MTKTHMIRFALAALFVAALAPTVVTAQAVTAAEPVAAVSASAPVAPAPFGPTLAPVGVSRTNVVPTSEPMNLQGTASRRDVSWMIIGGAALVVGSMVDGDAGTIIMVTGAVVGLTGLWRYLQ